MTIRTWESLTYSERHAMRHMLHLDNELGREVRATAGKDLDLAVWLLDAANAFADATQSFPQDIGERCWRKWRARGLSPQVAVQIALHRTPMALIVGEQLLCPVCSTVGEIAERDVAVRFNELHVTDGEIYASSDSTDFERDRYLCQRCGVAVRLPHPVQDWT